MNGPLAGMALKALVILGCAAALGGIGFFPTRNLAGDRAIASMFAACGVAAVASIVGLIPLLLLRVRPVTESFNMMMSGMAVRLFVLVLLGAAVVLSGWVERNVFLLWVAIVHLVLLLPDTLFSVQAVKKAAKS